MEKNFIRKSSYTIPIKLDTEEEKYLLVHGYTGAIDLVTAELLSKINHIEENEEAIEVSLKDRLMKRGYLTTKTIKEENMHVAHIVRLLHTSVKKSVIVLLG